MKHKAGEYSLSLTNSPGSEPSRNDPSHAKKMDQIPVGMVGITYAKTNRISPLPSAPRVFQMLW